MNVNPFKPTAGKMPPILIGRQGIIDDFREGLANGAGALGRLMLIMGQRGYGKTVMLTELRKKPSRVADIAERAGKSRSWGNKYRELLIAEKVIEPDDFGYVRFAIPHLAHYVRSSPRFRGL